jgi:hypothetical protein
MTESKAEDRVYLFVLLLLRNTMKILVSINKINYKSDINTTLSYTLSFIEKANDLINLSSVCYLTLVVRLSAERYLCFVVVEKYNENISVNQ